ncbi:hypothetical protein QYE76_056296 [Lolium multiflorum]|uniref:Reverse transcriptase domain-containing protein n=1 Tax=Lolium multiflorum TaxID=4521 RepID=A0AAD8WMP5_LOLMU|nr:hypothetical protein QYE76_056296 [Lolium multiflorum]
MFGYATLTLEQHREILGSPERNPFTTTSRVTDDNRHRLRIAAAPPPPPYVDPNSHGAVSMIQKGRPSNRTQKVISRQVFMAEKMPPPTVEYLNWLKEEDEVKTAFITPYGVFCYRTMPFGLKNAGATYQRMMQKCLTQIGKNVQVYIDDVVITSKKGTTLIDDLKETFDNLNKFCLKLNPTKCPLASQQENFGVSSLSKRD